MSICVMVKVPEGLALAADSAVTVRAAPVVDGEDAGPSGVVKVFYNATNLFQFQDLPIGVLSWGAGSIRTRTVASLVAEFENEEFVCNSTRSNFNVGDFVARFWQFMNARFEQLLPDIPKEGRPRAGFLICGYSGSNFFAEEYVTVVPTEQPRCARPSVNQLPSFGANWYGESDAIVRLHYGRDDRLFSLLKQSGIDKQSSHRLRDAISSILRYQVLFHAMPLGDAVDYAEFLVETTIKQSRFVVGAPRCGGPIDIATITRKNGFEWIQHEQRGSDEQ